MRYNSLYTKAVTRSLRLPGLAALMALALTAATSCSDSKNDDPGDNGNTAVVTLRTNVVMNVHTEATPIKELGDGQKMNVYVKAYNSIDAADLVSNASATNAGGVWNITPELRIGQQQTAFIYAFYPYNAANTNPQAIAVNVADQADVLYSGAYVAATYNSNVATLNMKHAQALLSVNVKTDNYSGQGLVTKLELIGGDLIATKGTINVSSGRFTATEHGPLAASVSATAGANGISGQLPSIWAMPFSTTNAGSTAVTLKVTVDGREYTTYLPEMGLRAGWQYIIHAVLTNNGLVVIPEATQEYQLDAADAPMGALNNHGLLRLRVTNGTFHFPGFDGDDVFGNVTIGSGPGVNYTIGGNATVNGTQTVVLETWNSQGFEISSFDNIELIDVSEY